VAKRANTQKEEHASETPDSSTPVGAVMVVGGGIAGMQASLDLADQGYRVVLVEKEPHQRLRHVHHQPQAD
jgi:heterodisulfide reductase subunit A-like polyferredoxin